MNIDKKFLLVCLQLIIVLVMSMIVEGMMLTVDASIESSRNPLRYPPAKGLRPREHRMERAYRLFHRCSSREVVIKDRVSTTVNTDDMHGDLVLESTVKNETLRLRIRGWISRNYTCYNRRGRLIAKPQKKANGPRCEFTEEMVGGGDFRFRSVYNPDWFIGFNKKGHPLKAHPVTGFQRREECLKFQKTNISLNGGPSEHLTRHNPNINEHNRRIGPRKEARIDVPSVSNLFSTFQPHMRHSKKSHRHRNRQTHFRRSRADR